MLKWFVNDRRHDIYNILAMPAGGEGFRIAFRSCQSSIVNHFLRLNIREQGALQNSPRFPLEEQRYRRPPRVEICITLVRNALERQRLAFHPGSFQIKFKDRFAAGLKKLKAQLMRTGCQMHLTT